MLDKLNLNIDPMLIKLSVLCAALGMVVSLFSCLLGGAGFPAVLYRPFLYAVLMGLIGAIVFYFIHFTAPEVINEFKGNDAELDDFEGGDDGLDDSLAFEDDSDSGDYSEVDTSVDGNVLSSGSNTGGKPQRKARPGEIMVEGVPIKNEPKVMAEAIKHLLEQDED